LAGVQDLTRIAYKQGFKISGLQDLSWTSTKIIQKVVVFWTQLRARLSFENFQNLLWPPKTTRIAYKQGFYGPQKRQGLHISKDLRYQESSINLGRSHR
jgi:hypothetical protein